MLYFSAALSDLIKFLVDGFIFSDLPIVGVLMLPDQSFLNESRTAFLISIVVQTLL